MNHQPFAVSGGSGGGRVNLNMDTKFRLGNSDSHAHLGTSQSFGKPHMMSNRVGISHDISPNVNVGVQGHRGSRGNYGVMASLTWNL
jgi:hypothetical protein